MWLCKYGTARKDICKTKLKQRFHSYCFFKASLWKVCEACPELFIRLNFPMISHCFIQNPAFESSEEKYYPHNFSAKRPRIGTIVKNHIQSSSCLFRTTLFVCSESDTSLMNYSIKKRRERRGLRLYRKIAGPFVLAGNFFYLCGYAVLNKQIGI